MKIKHNGKNIQFSKWTHITLLSGDVEFINNNEFIVTLGHSKVTGRMKRLSTILIDDEDESGILADALKYYGPDGVERLDCKDAIMRKIKQATRMK